jgi:hypothetical protein
MAGLGYRVFESYGENRFGGNCGCTFSEEKQGEEGQAHGATNYGGYRASRQ